MGYKEEQSTSALYKSVYSMIGSLLFVNLCGQYLPNFLRRGFLAKARIFDSAKASTNIIL